MTSIIIPAHNEASTIAKLLRSIADAPPCEFQVIVVCNGCTDETASVARRFQPLVRVIETHIAGKVHALNLGDQAATGFPRIYADADVVLTIDSIRRLVSRLQHGDVLAVAPMPEFDFTGCSWAVRACYEIRSFLPSSHHGIGGSGVYALSQIGRTRFGLFPDVISDDGYVRIHFRSAERAMVPASKSTVFPPKRIRDLIRTKVRAHHGVFELASRYPDLWKNNGKRNHKSLLRLFANLRLWPKLAIYLYVTIAAKIRAQSRLRKQVVLWERDNSSRTEREFAQ